MTERPQYFRFDKATDTVHLRPSAFPAGAFDEGAAGAAVAAEGAGLGGSGGKWCVAWRCVRALVFLVCWGWWPLRTRTP